MKNRFRAVLSNTKGAIDLASIMVGVIVIGLIGGVIAATVFAVIPWAQDNAAKHQLSNINTAQQAYIGMKASNTTMSLANAAQPLTAATSSTDFATLRQLNDAGYFGVAPADGSDILSHDNKICIEPIKAGGFETAIRSDSGRYFKMSASAPVPVETENIADTCLVPVDVHDKYLNVPFTLFLGDANGSVSTGDNMSMTIDGWTSCFGAGKSVKCDVTYNVRWAGPEGKEPLIGPAFSEIARSLEKTVAAAGPECYSGRTNMESCDPLADQAINTITAKEAFGPAALDDYYSGSRFQSLDVYGPGSSTSYTSNGSNWAKY
jgi:type II secretory pathway pseudopilin PulG